MKEKEKHVSVPCMHISFEAVFGAARSPIAYCTEARSADKFNQMALTQVGLQTWGGCKIIKWWMHRSVMSMQEQWKGVVYDHPFQSVNMVGDAGSPSDVHLCICVRACV
eukprot:1155105-Pelagomonas_calceolata.AAC.4